jgi:tetratricopeptide (TPR) repeat protein
MSMRTVMLALLTILLAGAWVGATDDVTDAKRRAAAELARQGKNADAVALLHEVVKIDPDNYKDHLALARAYDKLNKAPEAVVAYHRVLDLLSGSDDRAARLEAERRLKVLDAQGIKIQAAEEEFLKKLDTLEREAIAARDMRAVEQVFRLKGGVWWAQGRKDAVGFEVQASGEWQACPMVVRQGVSYHLRAAGTWRIEGVNPCTADGLEQERAITGGPIGCLIVAVAGEVTKYQAVGSDGHFVAPATGRLAFICNMKTAVERTTNRGAVYVLVRPD